MYIIILEENNFNMTFWQRLKLGVKKLGPTGKVIFWATIIAPIISILGLFLFKSCTGDIDNREIDKSINVNQTMINSPNATQILIDDLTVNFSSALERNLIINAEYVNILQGDKYVTLLRGRLKAPYPVPYLRIEAYGETVEKIEFTGTRIYVISDRGKNEGYAFAIWQDAIGSLKFKIISRKPGKIHVRFVVQE